MQDRLGYYRVPSLRWLLSDGILFRGFSKFSISTSLFFNHEVGWDNYAWPQQTFSSRTHLLDVSPKDRFRFFVHLKRTPFLLLQTIAKWLLCPFKTDEYIVLPSWKIWLHQRKGNGFFDGRIRNLIVGQLQGYHKKRDP